MRGIKGALFVVTGAATGIGEATCQAIAGYGGVVLAIDKEESVKDLLDRGIAFDTLCVDLEDPDAAEIIVGKWKSNSLLPIKGLANIPSVPVFRTLNVKKDEWRRVFSGSVELYERLVSGLHGYMAPQSAIVNMGSIAAHVAQQDSFGTYAASKAAVVAYTRALARELAPSRIRVNSVSPGTVWTRNNSMHIQRDFALDRSAADLDLRFGGRSMLQRCADPTEVGEAIAFLLSDAASYITGHDLVVDGGLLAN